MQLGAYCTMTANPLPGFTHHVELDLSVGGKRRWPADRVVAYVNFPSTIVPVSLCDTSPAPATYQIPRSLGFSSNDAPMFRISLLGMEF